MDKADQLKIFSQNLKFYRESKGFSQQQLASIVGMQQQSYYRYEAGIRAPSVFTASVIALALGVSIEDLLIDKETGNETEVSPSMLAELVDCGIDVIILDRNNVQITLPAEYAYPPYTITYKTLKDAYTDAMKTCNDATRNIKKNFCISEILKRSVNAINQVLEK